ncbi:flagellar hook-basal body complex protein [Devosia sp. BK]|uniref:flagellar hook-basal body complex protein n=1 Tax=Devosia sp. BK TaxID=2871706 RepID=UPI00293A0501|nr:flagellar hook-basal body complex protein [Devosia sp. BK]MDV3250454.1 flagellar hook-basal body complex protein [Devosia sp. BK]
MGIFGALQSAVSGLKAQSHAMENISGNIANSQTIGFKRIDTSFVDMIPDAPVKQQIAGAVSSYSRSMNTLRGDIQNAETETYMALNGNGFFVVEQGDGSGGTFYTRRGDFDIDRNGYLVNGAGYRLTGLGMNNGVVTGSVAEAIKIDNSFLPAKRSTTIDYQLNLPQVPKTSSYVSTTPGSELFKPWNYSNVQGSPAFPKTPAGSGATLPATTPAYAFGATVNGTAAANSIVTDNDRLNVTVGGITYGVRFNTNGVSTPAATLTSATAGNAAVAKRTTIDVASRAALVTADNFFIGSTAVPLAGVTTDAQFQSAIETALSLAPGSAVLTGTSLVINYPAGASPAETSAAGAGVALNAPGTRAGTLATSATTVVTVPKEELANLRAAGNFNINGTAVTILPATGPITPANFQTSVNAAIAPATATYDGVTGQLTVTYPAGARAADTTVTGSGTEVAANGSITTMLADMETKLRALTGDAGMSVGIRNGRVAVIMGDASTQSLAFTTDRVGSISGDAMGLSLTTDTAAGVDVKPTNTLASLLIDHGDTLSIQVGSTTRTYRLDTSGTLAVGAGETRINATGTVADMLASIEADLKANGGPGAAGVDVDMVGGRLSVTFAGNYTNNVMISGNAAGATKLNIAGSYNATSGSVDNILSADSDRFVSESISGGGITVYSNTGEPVNVQMRWAKMGGTTGNETWGLFYASDSRPGASVAWTKLADYSYDNGILSGIAPAGGVATATGTEQLTISNLTVNGTSLGQMTYNHGLKGMTQFADNSGAASTTALKQNGYGAGEFISVGVSDAGRVVASYTNGETREVAQIVTASFNNANALKRGDGGTYTATVESGEPIVDQSGSGIVGGSTEASNTDISEEFTKLIVTQQAYSANTKIVTAADEMLKEALNMIR